MISETLEILIDLQEIDREIYLLKTERNQKPETLRAHQAELAAIRRQIDGANNELEAYRSRQRLLEGEVADSEALISKYNQQLAQIKTNREYQTLLAEIETERASKRHIEDKVLESLERIEQIKKAMVTLEEEAARKRARLDDEESEVRKLVAEIDEELRDLELRRAEIAEPVPADALHDYERLLTTSRGQALAAVEGQTCTACYTQLPLNTVNRIHIGAEFVKCPSCSRILYIR